MTRPPRLLSGPIEARDLPGLRFELLSALVTDLGRRIEKLHEWALAEGQTWLHSSRDGTTVIEVEAGFITDFSSIPVGVEFLTGDRRKYRAAGANHDKLAQTGGPRSASDEVWWLIARQGHHIKMDRKGLTGWIGRKLGIERLAKTRGNVGPVRAWLGWAALRAFGWAAWRRWERVREAG